MFYGFLGRVADRGGLRGLLAMREGRLRRELDRVRQMVEKK